MTNESKPYEDKDIEDLFDQSFLPIIQQIAKRIQDAKEGDKYQRFYILLSTWFEDLEEPLKYSLIKDHTNLSLIPKTAEQMEGVENQINNASDRDKCIRSLRAAINRAKFTEDNPLTCDEFQQLVSKSWQEMKEEDNVVME